MKRPFGGRILLIRRKYVAAVLLIAAVIGIFTVINHPAVVGRPAAERILPIYSVRREDSAISLTFNAADADDSHTTQVMQILNALGVRATFFVTGDWVRQNETLARRLTDSGHELMNLSDDHNLLRELDSAEIRDRLEGCNLAIENATGIRPNIFRVPHGGYDDKLITLAAGLGLHTVQWSVDSGDWRGGTAEEITRQVQSRAFPGGIVLLHSNLEQTVQALPEIIRNLWNEEYVFLPVSELVIGSEFTVSITGRQIPV